MSFQQEKIENWVSDFMHSDCMSRHTGVLRDYAPEILKSFLQKACEQRQTEPENIEIQDCRLAFQSSLHGVPSSVSKRASQLIADFLIELTKQGRIADGETLALTVQCMEVEQAKPLKRPGSKLNRNDPCPCGSGRKYKKCCMNLLD